MKLILLVGPPGSGKSTYATMLKDYEYVNQDSQGKEHLDKFKYHLQNKQNVVVDRMNFSKEQRDRYLVPAKEAGYETEIVVFHESYNTCLERMKNRKDHPTINTLESAQHALGFFFSKYERVQDSEANEVKRLYPDNYKKSVIICDLDGTLCNVDHRLHFVKGEGKKDWGSFFNELKNDTPNEWCRELLWKMEERYPIIFCSGRPDSHKKPTEEWLNKHMNILYGLFMRQRNDFRADDIVKEQILDFEILTRYNPIMVIDDRDRVVKMWRERGITCLQCAPGDF